MRLCITVLMMAYLAASGANSHTLIANPNLSTDTLTDHQLKEIFILRQQVWDDGDKITLVINREPAKAFTDFSTSYLNLFPHQLLRLWRRAGYSGISRPPELVDSDEAVYEAVRSTPGAIGLILEDAPRAGVKRVEIQ